VTRRLALVWLGAAALLAGCGGASPVPTSQQPTGPRATTKPSRTRATRAPLRPPFRTTWVVHAGSLIEFPPAILNARLFFGTNAGRFLAVSASTGEIVWERELGRCIAASPAVDRELVYVALMDPYPCATHDEQAPGFLVALDADTGRERWRFKAGGPVESSPLLVNGVLYVGSWDRRVYALGARHGQVIWTFETGGKVKGGAAFADGTVFIGSYDGRLYALDARDGRLLWSADVGSSVYATPLAFHGRIYVGGLGGDVRAFRVGDGHLLWTRRTGGYVYSSVAVWRRTAYVGSYDGRLYALDASSGRVRWTYAAGGPISGTPTILAGVVYVATCAICIAGETRAGLEGTYALDARTGRLLWTFPDGDYTPLVADRRRAYLVGYSRLFGLVPASATGR